MRWTKLILRIRCHQKVRWTYDGSGLTITLKKTSGAFCKLFDEVVRQELDDAMLKGVILTDGELKPEEFRYACRRTLRCWWSMGTSIPRADFDGEFKVLHQKLVGEKHLKLMLEPLHKGHQPIL